ncbi:unnamed protein product, partial [Prorocentrum cordatum]
VRRGRAAATAAGALVVLAGGRLGLQRCLADWRSVARAQRLLRRQEELQQRRHRAAAGAAGAGVLLARACARLTLARALAGLRFAVALARQQRRAGSIRQELEQDSAAARAERLEVVRRVSRLMVPLGREPRDAALRRLFELWASSLRRAFCAARVEALELRCQAEAAEAAALSPGGGGAGLEEVGDRAETGLVAAIAANASAGYEVGGHSALWSQLTELQGHMVGLQQRLDGRAG